MLDYSRDEKYDAYRSAEEEEEPAERKKGQERVQSRLHLLSPSCGVSGRLLRVKRPTSTSGRQRSKSEMKK